MLIKLEGRKNAVEIELKERLQRRREELRLKLEAFEEPENDTSSENDLEARTKELKTSNCSIDSMSKKLQGEFVRSLLRPCGFEYLFFFRQRRRRKVKSLLHKSKSFDRY